ncbi:MAG: RluA family pseudouridine synthase [Candidatus Staskawiczbacteria bacterium]|nr:RluA family pseudouridine synthase [Candidatus Staskawiczbacteria bacterium]
MDIKIIYEDKDLLVVEKPAGIVVFPEGPTLKSGEKTLIDYLIEQYPELKNVGEAPRYGVVHRLDKDTSGVLLVAKSAEGLIFLQKQFKNREVEKKYVCLVEGTIKEDKGKIKTLMARSPKDGRKQKVYLEAEPHPLSAREAITEYKVIDDFKDYTLLEVQIKTGRRHQIRCHFSYLQHPIAGDKLYGFKNSKNPRGSERQFLHAQKLKIQLPFDAAQGRPTGKTEEFISDLPEDLKTVLKNLVKE